MTTNTTPDWSLNPVPEVPEVGLENSLLQDRSLRPGGAVDTVGLISSSGKNFAVSNSSYSSINQLISGATETDITGISLSFTPVRGTYYLITFFASMYLTQSAGNTANFVVKLMHRNTGGAWVEIAGRLILANVPTSDGSLRTYSNQRIIFFPASTWDIKLTGTLESITGNPTATIYAAGMSYLQIGT
jgi:hypothetical protein